MTKKIPKNGLGQAIGKLPKAAMLAGLLLGCNAEPRPAESGQKTAPVPEKSSGLRTEYFPPDLETSTGDTLLPGGYRLEWATSSLNDSALIDTAQDEQGQLLIVAHNHQPALRAWQNGQPLFSNTLTKAVFGSVAETRPYEWHFISCEGYRAGEFIFWAGLYHPDSDVGKSAEIAVDKRGNSRLVKLLDITE